MFHVKQIVLKLVIAILHVSEQFLIGCCKTKKPNQTKPNTRPQLEESKE